jgi:hypothetical protein
VARAWEEAFFGAMVPAETRKVALRIGMVLANEDRKRCSTCCGNCAARPGRRDGRRQAAGELDPHGGFPAGRRFHGGDPFL